MKPTSPVLFLALGALIIPSAATAKTVYVDINFGPGGTGTAARPYDTITKALADFASDTIIVMPGVYQEQVRIKKHIRIVGYDGPNTTVIDGSTLPTDTILIHPDPALNTTIEGIKVSGGRIGIHQPPAGTMVLRNVIATGTRYAGVLIAWNNNAAMSTLTMVNCVLSLNQGHGLLSWQQGRGFTPSITVYNTIFAENEGAGVTMIYENIGGELISSRIVLDYNVSWANKDGNYSEDFAPGKSLSIGLHSDEKEPEFVGGSGGLDSKDFRLAPTSPLRDRGNPTLGFLDPDGTRNDIGAYGGPGARTFYTNPNDGPMVREVTIDKGVVPKGETFTIRAKAAVR